MLKDYAYRTVDATITNNSGGKLTLKKVHMPWGRWIDTERSGDDQLATAPAAIKTMEPGASTTVTVETAVYLSGCEATLTWDLEKEPGTTWNIYWDNPYCGANTYKQFRETKAGVIAGGDPTYKDLHEKLAKVGYEATGSAKAAGSSDRAGPPPQVQGGSGGNKPVHLSVPEKDRIILWFYGDYPYEYSGPAAEVALLNSHDSSKYWTPTSKEFKLLADYEAKAWNDKYGVKNAKVHALTNLRSFTSKILAETDKTIARINIVTHGKDDLIGLAGSVDGKTGVCRLGSFHLFDMAKYDPINHSEEQEAGNNEVLDLSRGVNDMTFATSHAFFNDATQGQRIRDQIRKKFVPGAELYFYACHTGGGSTFNVMMLKGLATCFQIWVYGFDSSVYYHPTVAGNSITNRLITGVGKDEADAIANEGTGLVHNDTRPQRQEHGP
ncbi:MAG: hypothetical protein U0271_46395 [Polyangiaceae bacterium]